MDSEMNMQISVHRGS